MNPQQRLENLFDVEFNLKVELKLMRRLIREQRTTMTSLIRAQQSNLLLVSFQMHYYC